jgi:hypothetical protein
MASNVSMNFARARASRAARKAHDVQMKGAMKWLSFQSSFVLETMCEIIGTGIRTDKGFKEVHLIAISKTIFEHCGAR